MPLDISWKNELAPLAQRYSDREAVHDADGVASYREIFDGSAGVAETLRVLGVQPGEVVATYFRNSRRAVQAAYGVLLGGACEVAVNAHLSCEDVRYCLKVSGAGIVLTDRRGAASLKDVSAQVIVLEDVDPSSLSKLASVSVPPDAWARMVFTSGTTGRAKGIVHTHGGRWIGNLLLRASLPTAPKGHNVLMLTPFSHGASLLTFAFLDGGGSITLLDGLDVSEVTLRLQDGACDQFFASPTILAKLLPTLEHRRLEAVNTIYCGTAPLSREMYEKVCAVFGPIVRITYGKTEVFNPITIMAPDETDRFYSQGTSDTTCVGWPAGGVELKISKDGDDESEAPVGEAGPVLLRSRHMLAGTVTEDGYQPHGMEEFHRTGDVGYLDDRGRLHLCGREADMMKSGGYKIAPEEVEAKLRPLHKSGELVVFGCPSTYWGEIITLVLTGADKGWRSQMEEAMSSMTSFKRPRLFVELEALPHNAMGKVSRSAVREEVLRRYRLEDGAKPMLVPQNRLGKASATSGGELSSKALAKGPKGHDGG